MPSFLTEARTGSIVRFVSEDVTVMQVMPRLSESNGMDALGPAQPNRQDQGGSLTAIEVYASYRCRFEGLNRGAERQIMYA